MSIAFSFLGSKQSCNFQLSLSLSVEKHHRWDCFCVLQKTKYRHLFRSFDFQQCSTGTGSMILPNCCPSSFGQYCNHDRIVDFYQHYFCKQLRFDHQQQEDHAKSFIHFDIFFQRKNLNRIKRTLEESIIWTPSVRPTAKSASSLNFSPSNE